jgi:hypothetical protein
VCPVPCAPLVLIICALLCPVTMDSYLPCRCKVYLLPSWDNRLDLYVKQGLTFCLHKGQTYIMEPNCSICYPAILPRDPVLAPVPLPSRIMTLPSSPVTVTSLDSLTPVLVDPPLPHCPCPSTYPHMPQRCYRTDKVFSCYTNGRK